MIRLVVFDCDGTLVDSQHGIHDAMTAAFARHGRVAPPAEAVRAVVGLSLIEAVTRLLPGTPIAECRAIASSYQAAFHDLRRRPGFFEPMFTGAREALDELRRRGHLLGMATGKSRRGIEAVLAHHDLVGVFASVQTADRHPGKPHPAMLEEVLAETGSRAAETVVVGDTTYDIEMARAAGVRAIGVAWGYHPPEALRRAGAADVIERFDELLELVAGTAR